MTGVDVVVVVGFRPSSGALFSLYADERDDVWCEEIALLLFREISWFVAFFRVSHSLQRARIIHCLLALYTSLCGLCLPR